MPTNKINAVYTAAQKAAIQAAIDALIDNLPVKVNLTKKEKTDLPNIDNERHPYVRRTIRNHAPANPTLVTGFAGTLAEATNDLELYHDSEVFIPQIIKVLEMYVDMQHLAGAEAYMFFREFYNTAQRAAENMVPGADSIVDDLKSLFENSGPQTPPPTTPIA